MLTRSIKQRNYIPHIQRISLRFQSNNNLPNEADVVIIGGGAIGASTLYHLSTQGVNAILLEKDQITAGTTWHSAGLLWRLRPNDTEIKLIDRTRELVKDDGILQKETGLTCGWNSNGGLFIASNKERMDEYKRLHTIGKYFNIESQILSPAETKDLYPLMNVDDIYGTLYSVGDGTVEPAEYVNTLSKAAKNRGAKIYENTKVSNIEYVTSNAGNKSVKGVITANGQRIKTNKVVIAGGVWSRDFAAKCNVNIPLCAMKHAYVLTDSIPGIRTMPCVRDHDLSVYLRVQGDCLQVGGYEMNPIFWREVDEDFAFSLFNLDWDVFSVHLENGMKRVPIIEETGIKTEVCGPESFTADHKPLMGPVPEFRDKSLFVGAGFNSAGIMLSGGCGQQLSQWIINGYPDLDVFGYDISRFHPDLTNNDEWIYQRSHESYAKNYSIVFPNDEPLASRSMRTSPIHDELLANGCVFEERHGFERPSWFTTTNGQINELLPYDYYGQYNNQQIESYNYRTLLDEEYTFDYAPNHEIIGKEVYACRNKVAVFDQSYFGKFYLKGIDAQNALQYICTNNINKAVGSTIYTQMCNANGKVECDLAVSRIDDDEYYITAGGGSYTHDFGHIAHLIEMKGFECTLTNKSEEAAMLSVMGPNSRSLLYTLMSERDQKNEILSNELFPFATNQIISLRDNDGNFHELRAIRLTFVGELGWELHIPSHSAKAIYLSLMSHGKEFGVVNAGYRAIDSLSLEKGYLHWHEDVTLFDTPFEAGVGFVAPKSKLDNSEIDFHGKEALLKQKIEGLKKRLVYVTLSGNDQIRLHGLETIWRNGTECVGYLRRASFDYSQNKSIGTGYVIHHEMNGGKVTPKYIRGEEEENEIFYELESMGKRYPCTLATKASFDPKNERIHGRYGLAK